MHKDQQYFHQYYHEFRHLHRQAAFDRFSNLGISQGQPMILLSLQKIDGCIQKDLSNYCHIKPSTVTKLIDSLEAAKLIRREISATDRRVFRIFLTELGRTRIQEIQAVELELDEICMNGFREEEKEIATDLMRRMVNNLLMERGLL